MRVFKRLPRGLVITLSLFAFILVGFKGCVYNHHLSFIPKGMGAWWITYSKEESWGFGPGGNEAGAIAYSLPTDSAKRIERGGIAYLLTLKPEFMPNGINKWNGIYEEWHPTPMDAEWVTKKANLEYVGGEGKSGIAVYLYNMGFMIDPDIENEINKAIREPGNFYARGRSGIIIVAPEMRRVFYVYSG